MEGKDYHALFCLTTVGDCRAVKLLEGIVPSADGTLEMLPWRKLNRDRNKNRRPMAAGIIRGKFIIHKGGYEYEPT